MAQHLAFTLGTLSAVGGTFGYLKSNSKPSLAGGLFIGSLYLVSGYLIQNNKDFGIEMALGTSVLLCGLMAKRAFLVKAPVPVMMFSLGLIGTIYYSYKLNQQLNGV